MPDRKKKQNPQGDYSFLDNYVVVEGPESEEGDRESVASMPALQHPAKHKPRTKVPAGRAIYDRGTVIIGKTSAIPVTLIGGVYFGPKWIVDSVKLHNAKKTMQEKRDHDTIPGWNGAKFQKTKDDTGAHILLDQRQVPTVWSRMTGGKAEEEKGRPAAPEVSVYFDQPKQASSQSMVGTEMGHSMLGIEFSRISSPERSWRSPYRGPGRDES